MGSLGESTCDYKKWGVFGWQRCWKRGSFEPYIRITSRMGLPPPPPGVVRRFTCPCTLVKSSNWSLLGPAALVFLALPIASSTSSHVIGYLRPLLLARGTGFHLILNGGILVELSLPRNSLSIHSWRSGSGCLCASQIFCWLALPFHVYSTCFGVSCIQQFHRQFFLPVWLARSF